MMQGIAGFPQRMQKARQAAGLSKRGLARRLLVNVISIIRWERGETTPSAADIVPLCEELHVSADWLLGISDKKKSAQNADTFKGADEKTS